MDVALLPAVADAAIEGYLRGLRDGGWTGSADAVRTTHRRQRRRQVSLARTRLRRPRGP